MLIEAALELVGPMLLEMAIRNVAAPAVKRLADEVRNAHQSASPRPAQTLDDASHTPHLTTVSPVQIVSQTPGRLRVEVAGVRTDPDLGHALTAAALSLAGVSQAEVNARTGRLLIRFDASQQDVDTLVGVLSRVRTRHFAPASHGTGQRTGRPSLRLAAVV